MSGAVPRYFVVLVPSSMNHGNVDNTNKTNQKAKTFLKASHFASNLSYHALKPVVHSEPLPHTSDHPYLMLLTLPRELRDLIIDEVLLELEPKFIPVVHDFNDPETPERIRKLR
jgi:hypothetical protein